MLILIYLTKILTDNYILHKSEFVKLQINEHIILSKWLPNNHVIQISFPGTFCYKLVQYKDGTFKLEDKTVYLKKIRTRMYVYLTVERIKFGLIACSWEMIVFLIVLFLSGLVPFCFLLFK